MSFWRPLGAVLMRPFAVWARLARCEARLDAYDDTWGTIAGGRHRKEVEAMRRGRHLEIARSEAKAS